MARSVAAGQPRIRSRSAAIALAAAAQALPWFFHLVNLPGPIFLPMHFAAILAGLALGPIAGMLNGLAAPTISYLLTGLPPASLVPLMTVEVGVYGGVAGYLAHRTAWRGLWVLLATLVAGRLTLLGAVAVLAPAFGLVLPVVPFVTKALVTGAIGIALQVAVLSPVARVLTPAGRP